MRIIAEMRLTKLVIPQKYFKMDPFRHIASTKSRIMQRQLFRALIWQVSRFCNKSRISLLHTDDHSHIHLLRARRSALPRPVAAV